MLLLSYDFHVLHYVCVLVQSARCKIADDGCKRRQLHIFLAFKLLIMSDYFLILQWAL